MKRNITVLLMMISMLLSAVATVHADPVVIEKRDDTDLQDSIVRDRSLQDGTLIYGMTPVYPEDVDEGTYEAEVISSSRFFRINEAKLENRDGRMSAVITISSTSYTYIYPGTAAEAEAAYPSEWNKADESSGYGRFEIAVEALNKEIPCAAYSKKKQKWYDREIVFLASSFPQGVVHIDLSENGGTITDTQDAAIEVIYLALAIIVFGGILNHFIKKRFYE